MTRLLLFLILALLLQFAEAWVVTHFGLVVLGALGWWMWSLWQGRRGA